eukprot:2576165-Ditylum_brightwellii.AAC.1
MPVSKNATLWLRGGGLKDDSNSIDNGQKAGSQNTSNRSHNHHHKYHNSISSNNSSGFDCDGPNKFSQYSSHDGNCHNAPRGRSNGRGYYSHDVNHHHSPASRCDSRGRHTYH